MCVFICTRCVRNKDNNNKESLKYIMPFNNIFIDEHTVSGHYLNSV